MINWKWKSETNSVDTKEAEDKHGSSKVSILNIKLVRNEKVDTVGWSQPLIIPTEEETAEHFGDAKPPVWWSPVAQQWSDVYEWLFDTDKEWHIVRHNGGETIINRFDVMTIKVTTTEV